MSTVWTRVGIVYLLLCVIAWVATLFTGAGLQMILIGSTILVGALIMGLVGLIYRRHEAFSRLPLALFHFWFYQFGTPALLIAFYLTLIQGPTDVILALFSVGGSFLFMGTALFVITIGVGKSIMRKEADGS